MPIEIIELGKLVGAILLFIIPGYLWSFLFFKPTTAKPSRQNAFTQTSSNRVSSTITRLERIIFGFVLTTTLFILSFFTLDLILGIPVTRTKTILIYTIYTATILILFTISIIKKGLPTQTKNLLHSTKTLIKNPITTIRNDKGIQILIALITILIFAAYMGFLPHLKDNYFLPFHVDEWIHWTYSKSFMETGSTAFTNPWLGTGISRSLEPGFVYIISSMNWLTGANFNAMFIFTPAIITMLASIAAFNLGNKHTRPFGLEAAICVTVIPTTCRMMGPSFFVPVATGIFLLIFLLWFLQQKKPIPHTLFVPIGLWVIFLIHPPTALAAMIITFLYALMILFEKEFKTSIIHFIYSFLPIGGAFALSSRYGANIQRVIDAFFGGKQFLGYNLPQIWVSFEHMGLVIWGLAIIGVYYAFSKGKSIIRTIGLSALVFIILIGLYDKLGYGPPIMYERSFMYLFLMICLLAGWGLAEFRRSLTELILNYLPVKKGKVNLNGNIKKTSILIPIFVVLLLMGTTVPAHTEIPYYTLINENDYDACIWIEKNIDEYQNSSQSYDKAAVDPFKASPFSAITRLHIVSSTMHPIPGYKYHQEVESFLNNCCENESFLEEFDVSVVYTSGCCTNQNLTMIYPNVFIFSGKKLIE